MEHTEPIIIPLSKTKIILAVIGSISFMLAGLWLIIKRPVLDIPLLGNPTFEVIAGVAAVIFFGICLVFATKKLTDDTPGLIINDKGITDNASAVSAGLILWENIREIKVLTIANQSFLMIIVKNPEDYINRAAGFIKRTAMELNYKNYGSPVSISATALKCNFSELYNDVQSRFKITHSPAGTS